MKIKNNIDLGKAFDVLKAALISADKGAKDHKVGYVVAYCQLAGFVEAHISHCTEEDNKDGETLPERDVNDIPDSMFRQ